MLDVLAGKGMLAEQYIQVLIAEELRENSKWIVSGGSDTVSVIELRVVSSTVELQENP